VVSERFSHKRDPREGAVVSERSAIARTQGRGSDQRAISQSGIKCRIDISNALPSHAFHGSSTRPRTHPSPLPLSFLPWRSWRPWRVEIVCFPRPVLAVVKTVS